LDFKEELSLFFGSRLLLLPAILATMTSKASLCDVTVIIRIIEKNCIKRIVFKNRIITSYVFIFSEKVFKKILDFFRIHFVPSLLPQLYCFLVSLYLNGICELLIKIN